jgi:hypothetical protein
MAAMTTISAIAALAIAAAGTAMSIHGQQQQAKATRSQQNYQAAVARNNSILAGRAAEDARKRGEIDASRKAAQVRQLIGRQRAVQGGSGSLVDQGSALDITSDTAAFGKLDALTIRSNAEREALGYEAQGSNFDAAAQLATMKGDAAADSAKTAIAGTALSGLGTVASKWYGFQKEGVFSSPSSSSSAGFDDWSY